MKTEVNNIHQRSYRAALGIVGVDLGWFVLTHITLRITMTTAQQRDKNMHDRLRLEIDA